MPSPALQPGGYPVPDWVLQGIQTVVDEMNRLGYIGTGSSTGNLGNLQPAVQTLVDSASTFDRQREKHTGFDPAANVNVILPSNGVVQDLQTYINQLEIRLTNLSASAPVNTVQPAAPSGTIGVDDTLTALTGTWTGGATGYKQVWYRVNVTTGAFTATGSTAATYKQVAADVGFKIAVAIAAVNAAGVVSGYVFSLFTAVVTGVLPANTVLPHITPVGPVATGVVLSMDNGTWSNVTGVVYTPQWTLSGAAIAGANSSTYTPISGQEAKSISGYITATTSQGSTVAAASNSVTISGASALTFTGPPTWPAGTMVIDQDQPIGDAPFTVTGSGTATFVSTNVYIDGSSIAYAPISVHPTVYNGHDDSYMTGNTQTSNPPGLTTLAGHTLTLRQVWQYNGVNVTSPVSGGKVINAVSAVFAVVAAAPAYSFVVNNAVTSFTPAVASGGTRPYAYAIPVGQPALPNGLTLNTDGTVTGSPLTVAGDTAFQIKVTDAAGATGTITVHMTITTASGVQWLASISAGQSFASMQNNYLQMLGGQRLLSSVSETTGVTGSNTIVGPAGATNIRFGKIVDPTNAARKCFLLAANVSDGETYDHLGRVELGLDAVAAAVNKTTDVYWSADEFYIPASRVANGGNGTIIQIHNSYPPSTVTGPWELGIQHGDVFPNTSVFLAAIASRQSNPSLANYENNEYYPWTSDNPGFPANAITLGAGPQTFGAFPYNKWVKLVTRYRGDPVGSTGIMQAWITVDGVTTQICNLTGIQIGTNDAPAGYPTDYKKSGLDDLTGGGSAGVWELRGFSGLAKESANPGLGYADYLAAIVR